MDELTQLLQQLAGQLGTTVEFLWVVMVRQARVEAIEAVIALFVICVLWYLMYKFAMWTIPVIKRDWNSFDNFDFSRAMGLFAIVILFSIVLCILTIAEFINISNLPTMLFNPEYWALKQILSQIH
jgi:hypothetical protein